MSVGQKSLQCLPGCLCLNVIHKVAGLKSYPQAGQKEDQLPGALTQMLKDSVPREGFSFFLAVGWNRLCFSP